MCIGLGSFWIQQVRKKERMFSRKRWKLIDRHLKALIEPLFLSVAYFLVSLSLSFYSFAYAKSCSFHCNFFSLHFGCCLLSVDCQDPFHRSHNFRFHSQCLRSKVIKISAFDRHWNMQRRKKNMLSNKNDKKRRPMRRLTSKAFHAEVSIHSSMTKIHFIFHLLKFCFIFLSFSL